MRVLRFLRNDRVSESAAAKPDHHDSAGLDAFAAEGPVKTVPPAAGGHRLQLALIAVGALAALQTIPTVLWLQNWVTPAQPVATVAAAPIDPVPPASAGATVGASSAPCSPAASGTAGGSFSAASAPTDAVKAAAVKPAAPAGLVAGLIAIDAPIPMHVYAGGRLVGTTDAETIMLSVGTHDLELVNEPIGFRARRTVSVQPSRTTSIKVEAPRVPVHVNAIPWADVWIDNQRIGETPIGNLQLAIGSHEVLFRHPELGERRMVVAVTMKEPARISIDLRKK